MSTRSTTSRVASKPVVLVSSCHRTIDGMAFHSVAAKYVETVRLAGGLPLLVPNASSDELEELLDVADGVMLTGSPSNVHPRHFGQAIHDPAEPLDEKRDAWTLALIPRVLAAGMPLLAICRGLQELNVALGGSLHQSVRELPGKRDHRMPKNTSEEIAYGAAHSISIVPGGTLDGLLGQQRIDVNSLHGQAIERLADGLRVEAISPDGVIEAVSSDSARGFVLAVQWHPEWNAARNPHSVRLFKGFGQACLAYRHRRRGPEP